MEINGKGSIWELKPGVYQYRFNLGRDPETGKYLYSPKRTLHCTKTNLRGREAELRTAMEDYKRELETGIVARKSSYNTVGEYADVFHDQQKGSIRTLSWEREGLDIEHIKSLFGDIKLEALKASDIKQTYAEIRKTNRFSESELHKIHTKLKQIMKEAVNDELISKNPCNTVKISRPEAKERVSLTAEEAARLQQSLVNEYEVYKSDKQQISNLQKIPHLIGTLLLLDVGMRRGEMLGLNWGHLDLESDTVFIELQYAKDKVLREPKSKKSQRYVRLSNDMVGILREWKNLQREYLSIINIEQSDTTPVVNNDLGSNMDPDNFNRWFRNWCVKNGFGTYRGKQESFYDDKGHKRYHRTGYEGLTPHMLRHTQATLLIGAGTDIKTVQKRLGHSSADMTINTYTHAIEKKN